MCVSAQLCETQMSGGVGRTETTEFQTPCSQLFTANQPPYLCILWMLSGVNSAQISLQQIEPLHAICFNLASLHCQAHF